MQKKRIIGIVIAIVLIAAIYFLTDNDKDTSEDKVDPTEVTTEASSEATTEATTKDTSEATTEASSETTSEATSEVTIEETEEPQVEVVDPDAIDIDGYYTTKDDVSLYIYTFGELPSNFMTKDEARSLGWEGGSLEPYAPGMCIGGDYFGNYEGLLPKTKGREYHECDIDTMGASSRGAKRIIFSNDGLIYYTDDHYESFTLLYGEE